MYLRQSKEVLPKQEVISSSQKYSCRSVFHQKIQCIKTEIPPVKYPFDDTSNEIKTEASTLKCRNLQNFTTL